MYFFEFTGVKMNVICPNCNHNFELKLERKPYKTSPKDPIEKAQKILFFLKKQSDWVWLRKIAKETKLTPYAVSYVINKYLYSFLDILDTSNVYESSGLKLKMFRLKDQNIDPKRIIDDLKVRSNS